MLKDEFLGYLRLEKNYSENTIINYRIDISEFELFLKSLDDDLKLESVDADVVRMCIGVLADKYAATSVNRKLSSLKAFYRYLLRRKIVETDPAEALSGLKRKKILPVFVRTREMDRLLDEIDFGASFEGVRNRLMIEVLYSTGMRLSELINLKDADVDFGMSVLKVLGKRNKQRLIPFGEELRQDMMDYVEVRDCCCRNKDSYFFLRKDGKKVYPSLVYSVVKNGLAKVVTLRKRSPHVLRHSFATSMLNNGASLTSVKELLGHERLTTTEIYTHTTFDELKKIYKQAHPRA